MKRLLLVVVVLLGLIGAYGKSGVAQTAIGDPAGITVTGTGNASLPAESARMEIILSDYDRYGGMMMPPEVEATPGAEANAAVTPVVDAVGQLDGVESVEAVLPPVTSPYGPAPLARLNLAVSNPSQDVLQTIVTTAVQAAAGENLMVVYVGALFSISECDTLESFARAGALADAERQAAIQANLMDVGLGEIVSVVADSFAYYASVPSAGCDFTLPGMTYVGDPTLGATLPAFDPTRDAPEVWVYRVLRVTFAVDETAATPAA